MNLRHSRTKLVFSRALLAEPEFMGRTPLHMIELSMLGLSLPTDPDSVTMDVVALQAKAKHKEAS